ncbi:hypothetical protein TL16_g10238 [Triparma laevis f. inornata]|uniref:D-aminoacyl-tRNA deacylase n=2 Tax=Triparma laevis TaxID=1534972 RepID=A0A9W7DVA9_9STRA|nr:hypothetical protein TrLO_g5446 [Triparma laevis f. longispina]GMH85465.1 hypothetical protein TL16_g10238 [Triparma laevis f. inornata]
MRLVLQRVKRASVTVDSSTISSIDRGIVALVGIHQNDTEDDFQYCAKKLCASKLWNNEAGKPWKQSVVHMGFEILCVSQFTLYGSVANKKHCPDYKLSMKNASARVAYERFKEIVVEIHNPEKVKDGEFAAMMDVELVNDGPVTIIIDSPEKDAPPNPPPTQVDAAFGSEIK